MCQLGHHFYHQVPILHTSHGLLLRMWHMHMRAETRLVDSGQYGGWAPT